MIPDRLVTKPKGIESTGKNFLADHYQPETTKKTMKRIKVTIEQAGDGSFWCQTTSDVYGSQLNACGATVKEAKADLMQCLDDARKDYIEEGGKDYETSFCYEYDLQSFFNYFNFLNVSEIGRRAGINPSLMRQYANGIKKAGEKTYSRLSACLSDIIKELQSASLSE